MAMTTQDGYRDALFWKSNGLLDSIEEIESCKNLDERILLVQKAIKDYPHYYGSYVELFSLHEHSDIEEAQKVIKSGYHLAKQRLKDENNGKLPKKIDWIFVDNRHIHRIFYRYAEWLNKIGQYKNSNKILGELLDFSPKDVMGAKELRQKNLDILKKDPF